MYNINPDDNTIIDINNFETGTSSDIENTNINYQLTNGPIPFGNINVIKGRRSGTMRMVM